MNEDIEYKINVRVTTRDIPTFTLDQCNRYTGKCLTKVAIERTVNKKALKSLNLPRMYATNARSLFPKFDSFVCNLEHYHIDVATISETWEDILDKDHNDKIEILKNNHGYEWHSLARPKYLESGKRHGGGGVAVITKCTTFYTTVLDIIVPPLVEVMWVKLSPVEPSALKTIIFCGIYVKPHAKTKTITNDHLSTNYHLLKTKYNNVGFIFAGDFNDFKPDVLLQQSPQLRQVVHYKNHGDSNINLIVTDLHTNYHPPFSTVPLLPDNPITHKPSDHLGNIMIPLSDQTVYSKRTFKSIIVRPIKNSQMEKLGAWVVNEDWELLDEVNEPDDKVDLFQNIMMSKIEEFCPTKTVRISVDDPPWINVRIKSEMRKRDREYCKHGKSDKWRSISNTCNHMCKNSKTNYYKNFIENIKNTEPRTWMQRMKALGKGPDEVDPKKFQFPNEEDKSDQTIAEEIADYFADISANFEPVNRTYFNVSPPGVDFHSNVPCIPNEHEIYHILKKSKKTCSVSGDMPIKILSEFLPELTRPLTNIFISAIRNGIFPSMFKIEYMVPVPKVFPPEGYGDLRPLSMTLFFSKKFEEFILKGTQTVHGLLHYIHKFIDPNQFAVAGSSCTHALIRIIDFILKSTDSNNPPKAVINLLADWHKAFNKCNHNKVIKILVQMNIPEWILRLIISYLEQRFMHVKFRGFTSQKKAMNGGFPQGTLLGGILYICYINPVGFPAEITNNPELLSILTEEDMIANDPASGHLQPPQPTEPILHHTLNSVKYVDDATLQEVVDLKMTLCSNIDRSGPLPFHESSGKILPECNTLLQGEIDNIKRISDQREMVLNAAKTKLFIVNFTDTHQFKSHLKIPGQFDPIGVIMETKLLGYWLTTAMTPHKHVQYIVSRAIKRIFVIRRLKAAGVSISDLIYIYILLIRSILETACPVFHPMLTNENKAQIERIQKIVLKIALSEKYVDYEQACTEVSLQTLDQRRVSLCLNFGIKCLKNPVHASMFPVAPPTGHFTRNPATFMVPQCRTSRYMNSAIPYITKLLNQHFTKEQISVISGD